MPSSYKTSQHAGADVFTAIAHPTRREILDALTQDEMTVKTIAERFQVSRPAISQHLAVLLEAGLVSRHEIGRQNLYRLEAERLQEVAAWVQHYRRFWNTKLDALGDYLKRNNDADT